jgi:hypothetical protein
MLLSRRTLTVIVIILIVSLKAYDVFFVTPREDIKYTEDYYTLHAAKFDGCICFIDPHSLRSHKFSLCGDTNVYRGHLMPICGNISPFYQLAQAGDSVQKSVNSDTLTIYKHENKYYYEISRPGGL